jgi:hypothetical protein
MFRFLFQAFCLFCVAAGLTGAIIASFFVIAMVIVWFKEGAFQPMDQQMFAKGMKWLLGCGGAACTAWWLRRLVVKKRDDSFRLVQAKSGRLERLVERVSGFAFVIWLATQLWARDPGSAITTIPRVAGWITLGFLGLHAHIALHEMGHLVAAWLLRLSPQRIQVGVGPLLWSRAFANGLLCEWRAWPHGGFVLAPNRRTEGFRTRQSLFIAAGPLADLVVLWSAYHVIQYSFGGFRGLFFHGPGGLVFFGLFWLVALTALGGLIPRQGRLGPTRIWTDGYVLLRLLTGSSLAYPELAYDSKWKDPLEMLASDGSRSATLPYTVERELLASPAAFHEQRTRLSSELLRKPRFTFGPPA